MKKTNRQFYIFTIIVFFAYSCQDNTAKLNNIQPEQFVEPSSHIDSVKHKYSVPLLISSKQSECKTDCELRGRVIKNHMLHDTLFLKFSTVLDCGVNYSIEIEATTKESLNIKAVNKTSFSQDCYCLYIFELYIANIESKPKKILINGTPIEDICKINDNVIIDPIETQPQFPGGEVALFKFLRENIIYPQSAIDDGIKGTVYVSFVVEKNGSLSEIKIIRGIHPDFDEEVIRVVKLFPKWIPGKQKGKVVRVQFNLPVKFILND